MPLVTVKDLSIRFRGPALLDDVSCIIEPREKIGLLGRNGAGKSTFLNLLSGRIAPDHGTIQCSGRVALLGQEVPTELTGTVQDIVQTGVRKSESDDNSTEWEAEHKVDRILSQMELDPRATVDKMSSGMKRRVLLARALVDQPELLLLDEPTNHLDIDAICWLEDFLSRWSGSLLFITHDRAFLRKLAKRILEIDRGKLFDWTCDYDTFLRRKQAALEAEEKQNKLFDKKLAEEEAWIRQGIKARRTRNEGRVRALKELRRVRSERIDQVGASNLRIQDSLRSGKLVAQVESVSFGYGDGEQRHQILEDFTTTIMRGDKIGIVGPNGAGKTTLLRVLLGKLEPQAGNVRTGVNLQVAYFDQLREQLDGEKTVEQDVADGYDTIEWNGTRRHVLGYLQDFLFTPERARTPIKRLSGGEKNRILLAKLLAKPANVIVLDEPTNDLDAETMELLEERLSEFSGTLLIVSHDREFLNNVVTSCIAFETAADGTRTVKEYVGGYDDWVRQRTQSAASAVTATKPKKTAEEKANADRASSSRSSSPARRKLTFKESKELEQLPEQIEQLEGEISRIHDQMADPDFYKQESSAISAQQQQLSELEEQLQHSYARWEELDSVA